MEYRRIETQDFGLKNYTLTGFGKEMLTSEFTGEAKIRPVERLFMLCFANNNFVLSDISIKV